jgi:hypothetical protein
MVKRLALTGAVVLAATAVHLLATPYRIATPHQTGVLGIVAEAELALGGRFPRLSLDLPAVQACPTCSQSLPVPDFEPCFGSPCHGEFCMYTGGPNDDCNEINHPNQQDCWGCKKTRSWPCSS